MHFCTFFFINGAGWCINMDVLPAVRPKEHLCTAGSIRAMHENEILTTGGYLLKFPERKALDNIIRGDWVIISAYFIKSAHACW